jgi:hypothetical protein
MPLPPRLLGTTGLTVTPLGLGLAALGRPGYINLGHKDHSLTVLRRQYAESRALLAGRLSLYQIH